MVEKQNVTAHIFMTIELGHETDAIKILRRIPDVVQANVLYGTYDCVARIEAPTQNRLEEVLKWNVRRANYVRATLTLIERKDKDGPLGFEKDKDPNKFKFIHPSL